MTAGPEPQQDGFFNWRTLAKRAAAVSVAGVTIYIVLPSVTRVLSSWPRLSRLNLVWFAVAMIAEAAHFVCTFALQRLALRSKSWFPVVTAVLTGNAITNIMPGADAAGAIVQFRMLAAAGIDVDTAVSGLSAFSLIQIAGLPRAAHLHAPRHGGRHTGRSGSGQHSTCGCSRICTLRGLQPGCFAHRPSPGVAWPDRPVPMESDPKAPAAADGAERTVAARQECHTLCTGRSVAEGSSALCRPARYRLRLSVGCPVGHW